MQKRSSLQAGTLGELLMVAKLNVLGHTADINSEGVGHDVIVVVKAQPVNWRQRFIPVISPLSR